MKQIYSLKMKLLTTLRIRRTGNSFTAAINLPNEHIAKRPLNVQMSAHRHRHLLAPILFINQQQIQNQIMTVQRIHP